MDHRRHQFQEQEHPVYRRRSAVQVWVSKLVDAFRPQEQADLVPPSAPSSPPSALGRATGPQSRKRKRPADEVAGSEDDMECHDAASIASAESTVVSCGSNEGSTPSTILSNRPILKPRGPSQRASRSVSPTRTTLALLEWATPPISIRKPSSTGTGASMPRCDAVTTLKEALLAGYDEAIIPRQLESRLRDIDPDEIHAMTERMFDDQREYAARELDALWQAVRDAFDEADACHNCRKDENAWVQVVRSVLDMAGIDSHSEPLEVNSVQSQSIDPSYLPTLPQASTAFSKKADLAIVTAPNTPHTAARLDAWRATHRGTSLSHMSDAYTAFMVMACPLEVKKLGGDYDEAVCQLAVWSAAALEKLNRLAALRGAEHTLRALPYPGWTVVGHEWQLHIAWKEESGKVFIVGPYKLLTASTSSYIDIFRLRRLVIKLKLWLLEYYGPWVYEQVLGLG